MGLATVGLPAHRAGVRQVVWEPLMGREHPGQVAVAVANLDPERPRGTHPAPVRVQDQDLLREVVAVPVSLVFKPPLKSSRTLRCSTPLPRIEI